MRTFPFSSHLSLVLLLGALWLSLIPSLAAAEPAPAAASRPVIEIELCHVGNPGNLPDPATATDKSAFSQFVNKLLGNALDYGRVDYSYDIGKYDVTVAQYTAFLNAVARQDQFGLWEWQISAMGNDSGQDTGAGIKRSGPEGHYTYSVIGNSGNDPITFVSWLDAARFCNWLHNGQPTDGTERAGTTETGAYTLNGDTTNGLETRTAQAKWWIPTEDEWYKAAYYDPTLNGGAGGYWKYATRSNEAPGNTVGRGSNEANYRTKEGLCVKENDIHRELHTNHLTPVGSFPNSVSAYGTYDQTGLVSQWNDALGAVAKNGTKCRGGRGGSWMRWISGMGSDTVLPYPPRNKQGEIGFRIATGAEVKAR